MIHILFSRVGRAGRIAVGLFLFNTFTAHGGAQELTLEEAVHLAETGQPQLDARRSAVAAASEAAVAARELPDPKLKVGLLNVPIEGSDALSLNAEPMTMSMVGVMQEFPRKAKRQLRVTLANLSGERGALELDTLRLQIRRDTILAWLDTWSAERALELISRQQREARIEIESLTIALRNNLVSAADVSAARLALELLGDREQTQIGQMHAARVRLARWIGPRAHAVLPVSVPKMAQPEDADALARDIATHPHFGAAEIDARIADAEAQLAGLASKPDWSMEVAYARRGSQFGDMVSLQFQIDLPILQARRQDRLVAARLAEARQARHLQDDDLRDMRATVLEMHAQWRAAGARVKVFEERILPEAHNRMQAATASYRGGTGSLSEVLAARRGLLDLELDALMRRVETLRLAAALESFNARVLHGGGEHQ